MTAALRRVRVVTPLVDYYGGSVALQDIQTLNVIAVVYLHMAFLFRQSPVSIVSWYADCRICFRFFTTGSPAGLKSCLTTIHTAVNYERTPIRGFRRFPLSSANGNWKLTFNKLSFILISA